VDLSLIDVAVAALSNAWAEYRLTGVMPLRRGNGQPTVAPAADVVDTQDGQVVLSAYTEDHFSKLCLAIGHPELAKDPSFSTNKARVTNRAKLMELLSGALRGMSSDALCDLLAKGGVVAGAIRTMDQIQPGRAGVASDLFVQVASAGRESISIPGLPLNLQGIRREAGRLPALGEHTDEVLAGL
jgi:crotonobetainyl-CoA:carnitine CoA-transferase CaiB-like acyl-CoA transferase